MRGFRTVSLATVYKIFSGKDEIWDVLNRQRVDEFIAAGLRATENVASPLERLLAALRALVTYFIEHPNYLHLHIQEGLRWATAGEQWGAATSATRGESGSPTSPIWQPRQSRLGKRRPSGRRYSRA